MHKYNTRNGLSPNARTVSVGALNARLADAIDLALLTKQAHWNIKGPQFIALHGMIDGFRTEINHDYTLQALAARADRPLRNAEYLEGRGLEYRGTRFYGSPWTPELEGWAYYLPDGDLESRWASIPDNTRVLITHTPPYSVLSNISLVIPSDGRKNAVRSINKEIAITANAVRAANRLPPR